MCTNHASTSTSTTMHTTTIAGATANIGSSTGISTTSTAVLHVKRKLSGQPHCAGGGAIRR